jgi:hypothetical protein
MNQSLLLTAVAALALLPYSPGHAQAGASVSGSMPLPHTVSFSGGQATIKGPTMPEWTKAYALLSGPTIPAASWGISMGSMDPPADPNGPGAAGHGYVKCDGAISATIRLDVADPRLPPAVVVEESVYVSWSGKSGVCAHGLTGATGTVNSGLFDVQETANSQGGSKFVRRLTVFKNPPKTLTLPSGRGKGGRVLPTRRSASPRPRPRS